MQPAHRDDRTARRTGGERLVLIVALAQPGKEFCDVLGGYLADLGAPGRGQRGGVPLQVPAVRLDGVSGESALDSEMVEVSAGRRCDSGQPGTPVIAVPSLSNVLRRAGRRSC